AMPMLNRIRASQSRTFGAKTANLGEIASAAPAGVNVPPGFGLPFSYYAAHLRRSGLDGRLEAMLADPRFASDVGWRRAALARLRAAIRAAPLDPAVLAAVDERV